MSRKVVLAVVAVTAAMLVAWQGSSIEAQRRQTQRRRTVNAPAPSKTGRDYSVFKHEDHSLPKRNLKCSECHTIPSKDDPNTVAAATKPRIKGFPYHDSCIGCHRPQFFSGKTPTICVVCHKRSSPWLAAGNMKPFPSQSRGSPRELVGYFSHGSREHQRASRDCAKCHPKDDRAPVAIPAGGGDAAYTPAAGTFRTSASSHKYCFDNCHWDKIKQVPDSCATCHFTTSVLAEKKSNLLSPSATEWFKGWPREWPKRLSLKFNHESKNHRQEVNEKGETDEKLECRACHESIRRSEPREVSYVKIKACAECHCERNSQTNIRKEVYLESEENAEGRNEHTCTGCHTSVIGNLPPPASHYFLFGDKYVKVAGRPQSPDQISEKCTQ
jgi:hypothetical protein